MSRHGFALSIRAVFGLVVALGAAGVAAQVEGPSSVPVIGPFVANVDLRDLPIAPGWQPGDPIIIIPEGYLDEEEVIEEPLRSEPWSRSGAIRAVEAVDPVFRVNVEGISFTGVSPPDTVGDAGPNHYIQMTNRSGGSNVLVLDKQGNTVAGPFDLDSLWMGGGPCDNGLGDPIVVYDQLADRWLLTEFASAGAHLCIYVSQTADPVAGGWFLYDVVTPDFPDYPKYGVWPDAYYVTTFESSTLLGVYALDRTAMLAGAPTASVRFTLPSLNEAPRSSRLLPGHFEGGDAPPAGFPNPMFRTVEAAQDPGNPTDRIEIHHFHVDFAVPGNSTFALDTTLGLADFSFPDCSNPVPPRSCVPQPGTGNKVDALPGRALVQSSIRYDSGADLFTMTDTEAADAGGGVWGQRWWRLEYSNAIDGGPWTIAEQGLYSPDSVHRWMGSIAMNGAGDIALGFSVSEAVSTFPGVRVAGRHASDPAGTLPIGEYTGFDGTGSQTAGMRWGDYSSMSVDPADDESFWYTQEYIPANGQWRTRILGFDLDTLFADGFESGDTGAWSETTN